MIKRVRKAFAEAFARMKNVFGSERKITRKEKDSIELHTEVDGKEYKMTIPMSDVRKAFGDAMDAVGV